MYIFLDLRNPTALSERLALDAVVDTIRFFEVTKRTAFGFGEIVSVLLKILGV